MQPTHHKSLLDAFLLRLSHEDIEYSTDILELDRCSRDTSMFRVEPSLVVYPHNEAEISRIVHIVNDARKDGLTLSITARSAGTCMSGGPLSEGVILDITKYMNHTINVTQTYARVLPGMFYRDFERETLREGWLVPSYPASRELCTIGGMVANNSGGEKSHQYGKTHKYVTSLRVVLDDGEIITATSMTKDEITAYMNVGTSASYKRILAYACSLKGLATLTGPHAEPHVSKNSAGYRIFSLWEGDVCHMHQLFIGSQGTLGIVTEITITGVTPKTERVMTVAFLRKLEDVTPALAILDKDMPETIESYDDHTFSLAVKFIIPLFMKMKGGAISLGLSFLPEVWMLLTRGFPKLVIMAEYAEESPREAKRKAMHARDMLRRVGIASRVTSSNADREKYWTLRRESFSLLRSRVKNMRTAPLFDDIVVPVASLPEVMPKLSEILRSSGLVYTIAGHVGDGNFHIIPLLKEGDTRAYSVLYATGKEIFSLVSHVGGSLSGEHNDGLVRTPYLHYMFSSEVLALFATLKGAADPHNVFNPNKKVGGSEEYSKYHLVV